MILFYSLPENDHFYPEFVNMLETGSGSPCTVLSLYDNYDLFALERVVGEKRAALMTKKNAKSVYLMY